ncbi:hypothetical protein GCM10010885_24550 [Alicyclobacillus cellulosilyticus]|uniref:CobW/HypB/UreG nucleotide-binding domain-containing protein n=2 Tax=Alicyclobacillus cellulosilyticus TaxID=1003997 RepID=A0A917KHM9_9BACL|nr:hypothetical protein GCM10010885_24550 [Alicyclobacillus cellulosilyticus]
MIVRMARYLRSLGESVAVITNDQGSDLIDTRTIAAADAFVVEIVGGCFCCRFHELESVIQGVINEHHPTWILSEAVGSCTDLVATVMRPLRRLYRETLRLRPVSVVVDPARALCLLCDRPQNFSEEIAYLYRQQLCEADVILLNKSDVTTQSVSNAVRSVLKTVNPGATIVQTSALTGDGLTDWADLLCHGTEKVAENPLVQLDYDVYAQAEAQLGWVNLRVEARGREPFSASKFLREIGAELQTRLREKRFETAHVKMLGLSARSPVIGSLTTSAGQWRWSDSGDTMTPEALILVNARVSAPPEELLDCVMRSLDIVSTARGIPYGVIASQAFRPARPTPSYREA